MSHKVYAIVSVYNVPELIPHFLSHYTRLGVREILIAVRAERTTALAMAVRDHAKSYPATVHCIPVSTFADADKVAVEDSILTQHSVQPDDYVMHLDLDEFQEYPAPLAEVVRLMNQRQELAISGRLLDRVSEDGHLNPIFATSGIEDQFPIVCRITEQLLRACIRKIVLCRRRVTLTDGGRHATLNVRCDTVPIGDPRSYLVHHFKWTKGVDSRLRERLCHGAVSNAYVAECRRFLDHLATFGRIDLSNPRFGARRIAGGDRNLSSRVVNIHYLQTPNVGDLNCAPSQYFPLGIIRRDINRASDGNAVVIIGGGGLLSPWFYPAFEKYVNSVHNTLIFWGVGTHLEKGATITYPAWLARCALVGIRDFGTGYRWVPCASCMSPLFDHSEPIQHDVVVFKHARQHNMPKISAPFMNNHTATMVEAIQFLASARVVVTNSYHGMYWATLLGKHVIVYPFGAKHGLAKHKHVMLDSGGDWRKAVHRAVNYPEALAECRRANVEFYADVRRCLERL
jgi:hypothetical protein